MLTQQANGLLEIRNAITEIGAQRNQTDSHDAENDERAQKKTAAVGSIPNTAAVNPMSRAYHCETLKSGGDLRATTEAAERRIRQSSPPKELAIRGTKFSANFAMIIATHNETDVSCKLAVPDDYGDALKWRTRS
jgi:hypothetical protein